MITAASKATTPAVEGTTTTKPENGAPGFTTVFAICVGCLAIAYAMMRRRRAHDQNLRQNRIVAPIPLKRGWGFEDLRRFADEGGGGG